MLRVSGKTGEGVADLLDHVVREVPAPQGDADAPARAMIFDSVYDIYRGVVTYVRVIDGKITPRERIAMMSTGAVHELLEVGIVSPDPKPSVGLGVGEVGYLITGVKDVRQSKVGDTVTSARHGAKEALTGYREPKPMVYSGPVSRRRLGLPEPARRPGQAAAQRCGADLRAGNVGGARLRVPVWLPGPAAHGDHPRAPGARIRPGPDLDVAERRVPGGQRGQQRDRGDQPVGLARRQDPRGLRARGEDHHHHAQRVHRHDHGAVPVAPR